jgi:hypothetical protein
MADNAFLPSYSGPHQQVLSNGPIFHDLDVLGVHGHCHFLDRLLKQGLEVEGREGTGSEAGSCPLTLKAATKSLLQAFSV